MNEIELLKQEKRVILEKYAGKSDATAMFQVLNTSIPFFLLFYFAISSVGHSLWLTVILMSVLILFLMRVFMMMHDAGHKCLFKTPVLNKITGFFMRVFCGIPGHVWSNHHAYHHSTNGDWDKYQGPLNIITTEVYAGMTAKQQKSYRNGRNLFLAPFAGFMYFIFLIGILFMK